MLKYKLDVLLITRDYPPEGGGVASHVYYLAHALSELTVGRLDPRRICAVHVLTIGDQRKDEGSPPNFIVHRVRGEKRHFTSGGDVPLGDASSYVLNNWSKIKADVVHAHDFESLHIASMLKAAYGIPLVATVHKAPKDWDRTLPKRDLKDCALQAILHFDIADKVVAPSNAYLRRLLDQGFPNTKIEVIPHGVPVAWLAALPDCEALNRLNLQENQELILCPTRLDPHKGIDTFIEAASMVKDRLRERNLVFAIAGSGPEKYRCELQRRAESLSMNSVVRIGASDGRDFDHKEMAALYRRAKVVVLPSRREGFGQVLLEAFVFKRPVIAANTGGIPDIITPEETGLLFTRDEPHDLAYQLERLLEDETLGSRLTARAFNKLQRTFDSRVMAVSYLKLYKKVTGITKLLGYPQPMST